MQEFNKSRKWHRLCKIVALDAVYAVAVEKVYLLASLSTLCDHVKSHSVEELGKDIDEAVGLFEVFRRACEGHVELDRLEGQSQNTGEV